MAGSWWFPLSLAIGVCFVAVVFSPPTSRSPEVTTAMTADWLSNGDFDLGGWMVSLMQTNVEFDRRAQAISPAVIHKGPGRDAPLPHLHLVKQAPDTSVNATGNAEAVGVTLNAAGDLDAFISALIMYPVACSVLVCFFMCAARRYPPMYSNNVAEGWAPGKIPEGMFGWARASLNTTIPQYAESAGLDMAMLLQYTQLCMRILTVIGIPMCCIFGPLNYIFGGFEAGDDYLSYFSFGNVSNGKWHYWMYAFVVWYVCFVVQYYAFKAQEQFQDMRYNWLKELPEPRASTVLVENIPGKYQSDEKLRHFFDSLFTKGAISSAFVVKDTSALLAAEKAQDKIALKLLEAEAGGEGSVGAANVPQLEADLDAAKTKVTEARAKVLKDAETVGGVNLSNGFVTFTHRKDALIAENLTFGTSYDEMVVSVPPPESSVIWRDLQWSGNSNAVFMLIGYGLVVGLYIVYLPLTIWMSNLAIRFNMGPFQAQWQAVAPTVGIQVMVAFLPTILILIFRFCFVLKDDAWSQLRLQNWYFVFQVVFVILITAISSSAAEFLERAFTHPTDIPILLGETMPYATHFYMNFMVLQWMTHSMNLTRYIQLIKYKLFSAFVSDPEKARSMSEPEDQDYYGIGSRSARFSINMLICIIFGTLCPWMSLLGFINFFVCRLYYGYLIGFAENKKPDLGGLFWVQKLRNLFIGLILYVIMMTGVLYSRAATGVPAIISAISIIFVVMRFRRFEEAFVWERLPFEIVANETLEKKADDVKYIQPELLDPEDREKHDTKMGLLSAFATFTKAQRAKRRA